MKLHRLLLALILIVAALLRLVGTNPGHNQYHADEGITYSAATSMIVNNKLDSLRYDYPALVPVINVVFFKSVFIPISWFSYYARHTLDIIDGKIHVPISDLELDRIFHVEILGERWLNAMSWGRYVTALFSIANVLMTYVLARKLYNKKVGLVAALLLTFNYKQVANSHVGLPDIYNAFFVLSVFILCLRLLRKPTRNNYLLAGISVGLSIAIKYQFFAVIPFVLTHLAISFQDKKFALKKLFSPFVFMSGLAAAFVFLLIDPYHIFGLEKTIEIVSGVSQKYGMGANKFNIYPFWYLSHIDYGGLVFGAVTIGTLIGILKRKFRVKSLFLLSHPLAFMFIMVYYSNGGFYVRNFITVTPIFMIFASLTFVSVYEAIKKRAGARLATLVSLILLTVSLYVPGRNAIINSYYYTKPWGYDQMRPWVKDNIDPSVIVATHPFDAVNLGLKKTTEFEVAGAYSINEHKDNKAEYLLLDLNWAGIPFYFWMSYGFDELDVFWPKPLDIMRNTYHGIATEEFFRYQVHVVTKAWQAQDTHLIAVKFINWPDIDSKAIAKFSFDSSASLWKTYGLDKLNSSPIVYGQDEGKENKGSILFLPAANRYPTVRATSEPIEIEEGHLYRVEGYIKNEAYLNTRERDSFLRIDFYSDINNLELKGENATISSRVFGQSDWVRKTVEEVAPPGSKYMTVSFQRYNSTKARAWLDDLVVYESYQKVDDPRDMLPYTKYKIDLNYVYPNSHGNL